MLGVVGFDRRLEDADAVITGEGRLDAQSREGKLVGEIARRGRAAGVPAHVIAAEIALDPRMRPARIRDARIGNEPGSRSGGGGARSPGPPSLRLDILDQGGPVQPAA